jgi:hypothetical protein
LYSILRSDQARYRLQGIARMFSEFTPWRDFDRFRISDFRLKDI